MNPIESGIPSTAGFDSSAATAGAMTPSTTSANGTGSVATTSSTSSVSPQLQAASQSTQTTSTAANSDQFSLMTKVVDALVSVVTALVSLVTNLMNQFKGTGSNGSNGPNGTNGTGNNGSSTTGPGNTGSQNGATNPGNSSGGTGSVAPGQGTSTNPTQTVVRSALDVNKNDAGMITVRTLDGYTIRAEGRDQAWTITGPDGKSTRIWGDPHVTESDGDKWDFLNNSTFMFGKNKVTVEVVPAGNGQTYSSRITVYSDHERVTIDGLEKNQPSIVAASSDGLTHDASLRDGDIYKRVMTPTGEAWVSTSTNQVVPTTK